MVLICVSNCVLISVILNALLNKFFVLVSLLFMFHKSMKKLIFLLFFPLVLFAQKIEKIELKGDKNSVKERC